MIHLDVDCLDTSVGIANEYTGPGGLSVAQLRACLASACAAAEPLSLTIASFSPNLEGAEQISAAAIEAAVFVASAAAKADRPSGAGLILPVPRVAAPETCQLPSSIRS